MRQYKLKIFLDELSKFREISIKAKGLMSDDNAKYYSAWLKIIQHKPRGFYVNGMS